MYVYAAWLVYFVLGMYAMKIYDPRVSYIDAASVVVVGGALAYMLGGAFGRTAAEHGLEKSPSWHRVASATVAMTLIFVVVLFLIGSVNH